MLLFFGGFPAFVTWIAPITWTTFTRHDGRVEMKARVCVFFILPFRHETVAEVTAVDEQTIAGTREKWDQGSRDDRDKYVTTESQGYLVVHGDGQEVKLAVSPVNLSDVASKVHVFLHDPGATELHFFLAANWKIGVVLGGILCLCTVLFILAQLTWFLPASWQKRFVPPRKHLPTS